jgi:hypothetical protein
MKCKWKITCKPDMGEVRKELKLKSLHRLGKLQLLLPVQNAIDSKRGSGRTRMTRFDSEPEAAYGSGQTVWLRYAGLYFCCVRHALSPLFCARVDEKDVNLAPSKRRHVLPTSASVRPTGMDALHSPPTCTSFVMHE